MEKFGAVLAFDNALPHLDSDEDIRQALASMRARLHAGGKLLVSLRDYGPLMSERPAIMAPRQKGIASELQIEEFRLDDTPAMRAWPARYTDRKVDFADASLIWLADRCGTNLIATTDFDDFETYRLPNRKSLKLLIPRP